MSTLAHISDLHFGTEEPAIVAALIAELRGDAGVTRASAVIISGDVTQRARRREFSGLHRFVQRLASPFLVVPGNHDVPLHDLAARFLRPMHRFRREVTKDLAPVLELDDVIVCGIATAYGALSNNGRVTDAMADAVSERVTAAGARWKLVAAHHPFVLPVPTPTHNGRLVRGAVPALERFRRAGIDAILSGHLHLASCSPPTDPRPASVYAGTATSARVRGEPNSYNRIELRPDAMAVTVRRWTGSQFDAGPTTTYSRKASPTA